MFPSVMIILIGRTPKQRNPINQRDLQRTTTPRFSAQLARRGGEPVQLKRAPRAPPNRQHRQVPRWPHSTPAHPTVGAVFVSTRESSLLRPCRRLLTHRGSP
jgi:hypothetical protein